MTVFKSGIFLMFVFIEQSTQFSISSEMNSELPPMLTSTIPTLSSSSSSNQSGCLKTIGQCLRTMPNDLAACALDHAINNIDCIIASNATWHFNEFISLKKNDEWKPTEEIEARQDQTSFETLLSRLSDLVASRSVQFSVPQDELSPEGRIQSGFDFSGLTNFGSKFGTGIGPEGRKKKLKGGMMGNFTLIAMFAQLFLGKIAFLAGAALLLSKISLLFSIVSALKKQGHNSGGGGGGGGGDHVVYGDPGHGGYQRSIIESPRMNWIFTEHPPYTVSPIPM